MLALHHKLQEYVSMKERLRSPEESLEQLLLSNIEVSDVVTIIAGKPEEAWEYRFVVTETDGHWPKGMLTAISPQHEVSETLGFTLHGAGNWTTRRQNPVQTQETAFTSYWAHLYIGGLMVGIFEGQSERSIFGKVGQEISDIRLDRS